MTKNTDPAGLSLSPEPTVPEPSVQVPVSLIDTLRDLIERDAAYDPANPNARRSWEHGIDCESIAWGWDGIEGDSGDPCDCWVSVVTALLSQPTPSAEPPRIEDMAPGTTFRAAVYGGRIRAFTTTDSRILTESEGGAYAVGDIDPSTIRDVTPPATESTK